VPPHLLPRLRGRHERLHDRAVGARLVQDRLYRHHRGVPGRRLKERLRARGEAVVRVLHQNVPPAADLVEEAGRGAADVSKAGVGDGLPGGEVEGGGGVGGRGEGLEVAEGEGGVDGVDVLQVVAGSGSE
jgi:hypothetical protein